MTQLDQLASLTTIVADTGDIASIAQIQPQDATTNPSLILKASKEPAYQAFLTEAVENSVSLEDAADRVLVNFGAEILKPVLCRCLFLHKVRLNDVLWRSFFPHQRRGGHQLR